MISGLFLCLSDNATFFNFFPASANGDGDRHPTSSSPCTACGSWLGKKIKGTFRRKLLYKRIPIIKWLPEYRKEYVVSDMVAGITVGLTVIPQAIAYANVASLPLQVSLHEYKIRKKSILVLICIITWKKKINCFIKDL